MLIKPLECDVLIVGGGPAGLSVASSLPKDIRSIIVHQDKEIGRPVRTSGGTWLRDMKALGVPDKLYQIIDQLDFYSDNAEALFKINADKMAVLDITGLYQYLATLSDHPNRQLLLGAKFTETQQGPGSLYTSTIRSREKGDFSILSKYIIDASGWHCAVLESLKLAKKPTRLGVGIEYEFPRKDFPKNRAVLFVGSTALTGYGWIFPTTYDTLRLGIGVINPDTDLSPRTVMNAFVEGGHAKRYGIEIPDKYEINAGIIPSVSYDEKLVYESIIRTGDSANFATPTVGEGIRIAIEYGRLLGRELGAFIQGDRNALSRYESTCAKVFKRNYKFGFMMNKRIASYTPERWDRSVSRLSRLSEVEMTQLVRSCFSTQMILRTMWLALLGKFKRKP
jgi:digeranylgeranylglycerophospholipid reductase